MTLVALSGVTIWILLYSFSLRRCLSPEIIKCALFSDAMAKKILSNMSSIMTLGKDSGVGTKMIRFIR